MPPPNSTSPPSHPCSLHCHQYDTNIYPWYGLHSHPSLSSTGIQSDPRSSCVCMDNAAGEMSLMAGPPLCLAFMASPPVVAALIAFRTFCSNLPIRLHVWVECCRIELGPDSSPIAATSSPIIGRLLSFQRPTQSLQGSAYMRWALDAFAYPMFTALHGQTLVTICSPYRSCRMRPSSTAMLQDIATKMADSSLKRRLPIVWSFRQKNKPVFQSAYLAPWIFFKQRTSASWSADCHLDSSVPGVVIAKSKVYST